MKQFNDYNETKAITERPKIPAGGYIATIKQAEVKEYSGQNGNYERLEISFDIAEGEYKEFYANDYRAQSDDNKKWKGVLRLAVPSDDVTVLSCDIPLPELSVFLFFNRNGIILNCINLSFTV